MSNPTRKPMTVDAFIAWAMERPEERYELDGGVIVAMAPERARHNLVKRDVAKALDHAVRSAELDCTVFTDGMTVVADERTAYEPDAVVQCGPVDMDGTVAERPVIIVEVTSPSTSRIDLGVKAEAYFRIPTLAHYLIVVADRRRVLHYRRHGEGLAAPAIVADRVRLDPPGIEVDASAFFAALPPEA